ncbi:MAG: sugar ABC transporter permease [Bacillota bacterium]
MSISTLFLMPTIAILLCINLFPFVYQLVLSLTDFRFGDRGLRFIGLSNYIAAFTQDPRFIHAVVVTVKFSLIAVTAELILGFLLALLLDRASRRWRDLLLPIFIIPMVLSPIVVGYLFQLMYSSQYGIINYFLQSVGIHLPYSFISNTKTVLWALAAVDIWQWTPFAILVILAGLQSLPMEPYEAARVDGASPWQSIRFITLPLLKSEVLVVLLLRLLESLKVFDIIYALTAGGPGTATESISLYLYRVNFKFLNMGYAAAMSIIVLIVATCLARLFSKLVYLGATREE